MNIIVGLILFIGAGYLFWLSTKKDSPVDKAIDSSVNTVYEDSIGILKVVGLVLVVLIFIAIAGGLNPNNDDPRENCRNEERYDSGI